MAWPAAPRGLLRAGAIVPPRCRPWPIRTPRAPAWPARPLRRGRRCAAFRDISARDCRARRWLSRGAFRRTLLLLLVLLVLVLLALLDDFRLGRCRRRGRRDGF